MTFQKIPIPHLSCTMKQKFLHYRGFCWILYEVTYTKHNFFQEPKVALTKDLVYMKHTIILHQSLTTEEWWTVVTFQ